MSTFVPVLAADQLPEGSAREVEIDGRIIALFHVDGLISAIDGLCPHQGGPLADGPIEGGLVYCPWHRWGFDIYSVKVEAGSVWVAVD